MMRWSNIAWCLLGAAVLGFAALPLLPTGSVRADGEKGEKVRVYVGTYTEGKSKGKGIHMLELDLGSGRLTSKGLACTAVNPSFLAVHPNKKFLYAVGEVNDASGKKGGGVSAFMIEEGGKLTLLNQQSSRGAGPCHLVVDPEGKNVLVANYGGGNVASLPIDRDGKLQEATGFVQHEGKSVNKARQSEPHADSINLDAAGRFAFVADLGLDKVLVYKFDPIKGTLTANDPPAASVAPGAGPRHFAFHPNGKNAYVINELNSTMTAFSYDAKAGELKEIQSVTTLPEDYKEKGNSTAEVVVHPSGKFVYGSNRGHNTIAIFQVDEKTGKLTAAGHQGKDIKTPRNFAVDPTGAYLLAASQDADSVGVFRIDQKTGALEPTGPGVEVGTPVCIRFVRQ